MAHTPRRLRRTAAAAVVPLALVALAGCGGDESKTAAEASSSSSASSSASSTPSDDASTSPSEAVTSGEISADEFMKVFQAAFDGATTAKIAMKIDAGQGSSSGQGVIDYTTTPPSMQMTMTISTGGSQKIEMRMVKGVMYMQMAAMGSDKYLKFDLTDPNNPLGSSLTSQLDPRAMFGQFGKAIVKVTADGADDLDGEEMSRYTVVLDTKKMLPSLGDLDASAVKSMPKQMTYQLWFDGDGHYRQMTADLGSTAGTMTMTYSDWGTKVSITAPPASEVTDMAGMMGG